MVKLESAKAKLMDWAAPLTLLTITFSMPVRVTAALVPAVPPVTEIDNVSVPAPPLTASPAWNVVPVVLAAVTLAITPLNVSLPVPPVKEAEAPPSTPVVSDLSHALDKSLILNSLLRILDDLFLITYDAPTVTKIIVKLKVPKAEVLSGLS